MNPSSETRKADLGKQKHDKSKSNKLVNGKRQEEEGQLVETLGDFTQTMGVAGERISYFATQMGAFERIQSTEVHWVRANLWIIVTYLFALRWKQRTWEANW